MNPLKRSFWQRPNRKVVVDLLTSIVAFVLAITGTELGVETAAIVAKVIGFIAAYWIPERS